MSVQRALRMAAWAQGLRLKWLIDSLAHRCVLQLTVLGYILVPIFTSDRWCAEALT
jgi:ABC-type iron transport system FetAB permease component